MSEWFSAGRVSPVAAGIWNSTSSYTRLDVVTVSGGSKSYIAKKDVPVGTSLSNTEYWQCIIDNSEAIQAAANTKSELHSEILNTIDRLTTPFSVSGEVITCNPVAGYPLNVDVKLEPAQEGEGDPYPGGGSKNLLPNKGTSMTANGITFTKNADGSVTINGTATGDTVYYLIKDEPLPMPIGEYIASGLQVPTSGEAYVAFYDNVDNTDSSTRIDVFAKDTTFRITSGYIYNFRIVVRAGATYNNATYYPMIRKASESDSTYVPYSNIRPISGHVMGSVVRAGKNLAPFLPMRSINGVTFTTGEDGSVAVAGTATAESTIFSEFHLPAGKYIVSGAPSGSGFASYDIYVAQMPDETSDNGTVVGRSFDGSTQTHFAIDRYSRMRIMVRVPAGAVDATKVFYPMIRFDSEADASYEPYQGDIYTTILANDMTLTATTQTYAGVTFTVNEDGSVIANGKPDSTVGFIVGEVALKAGKEYILSGCPAGGSNSSYRLDLRTGENTLYTPNVIEYGSGILFTPTADATVKVAIRIDGTYTASNVKFWPVLCAVDNMIYGGTHDVDAGVLVVDRAYKTFNGTETWTAFVSGSNTVGCHTKLTSNLPVRPSYSGVIDGVCSHYKSVSQRDIAQSAIDTGFGGFHDADIVVFRDATNTVDVDTWKAYLAAQYAAGTPVQICYKLATPITIQLPAHDIPAVDGVNTVYSDSGDVAVNGPTDPDHLNKNMLERIAALEAAITNA